MPELLLPPDESTVHYNKVVFVAGPIQGAPDWQAEACTKLLSIVPDDTLVCCPRKEYELGSFIYERQVDWESKWLKMAALHGVIMFWLAAQTKETPGRSYGQTSRFELGEWFGHKYSTDKYPLNLIVGIEPGFGNERYIRRRISQANECVLQSEILVLDSLDKTCQATADALKGNI
jgi:hypothetical protein